MIHESQCSMHNTLPNRIIKQVNIYFKSPTKSHNNKEPKQVIYPNLQTLHSMHKHFLQGTYTKLDKTMHFKLFTHPQFSTNLLHKTTTLVPSQTNK